MAKNQERLTLNAVTNLIAPFFPLYLYYTICGVDIVINNNSTAAHMYYIIIYYCVSVIHIVYTIIRNHGMR